MARATTSSEQPSPPFYRGQRITRHNVHKVLVYRKGDGLVNQRTRTALGIPRPAENSGLPAGMTRLIVPALSLP